ncbi:hypothetical protein D3C80_1693540 [compost metagenome]
MKGEGGRGIRRLQSDINLRNKIMYSSAALVTIVLGLSSRAYSEYLPQFVVRHLGDALWAAMVYFGFRVLLERRKLYISFVLSIGFSIMIEFSQLYQAVWINEVRATILGGLVLGKGFVWVDLTRYSLGIMGAYILDRCCLTRIPPA